MPLYRDSHALIIGVNSYTHVAPLGYARNDAEAMARLLTERFDFSTRNIQLLLDENATGAAIRRAFARLATEQVKTEDRCCIFFAGHGHTRVGRRGDIGFLVPSDGDPNDVSTLIRWSELTSNSDLVSARHVLFLMDACYGGLALTRTTRAGSMRFLRNMLQRSARQVLTAGKADEVVADSGGPRAGHSVFTGHLLDALDGAAATADGVITANGVMAYVYDRVSRDPQSQQTPHYGHFDGDGDLVFAAPPLAIMPELPERSVDILVEVPASSRAHDTVGRGDMLSEFKEYLSDQKHLIRLDDLLNAELRATLARLEPSQFPLDAGTPDAETLETRIRSYEAALGLLPEYASLLGRWGRSEHSSMLARVFERLADVNVSAGGYQAWLALRWMPVDRLYYFAGIGALSRDNYQMLQAMYRARSRDRASGTPDGLALQRAVDGMYNGGLMELIKQLPGHERQFVPKSELYFKELQPRLDDLLFLGSSYEQLFDRFELLHALVYLDRNQGGSGWGPPGRFGWKHVRGGDSSPITQLKAEATGAGAGWPPLHAGLFGGSAERFGEVLDGFVDVLRRMNFH